MKLHCLTLLCVMSIVPSLAHADSYSHKEPFTKSAAFNATGEVTLENINGSVEVHTWNKNEILIEGVKSAKTDEELRDIELTIDTSPERAAIRVRLPKRGFWPFGGNIRAAVHFKLKVPTHAVLREIGTVNGSLTLNQLQGQVDAHTVNGAISARDLGASAEFKTVNGSIKAGFTTVTADQHLSLQTVNGGIVVALPKDAGVAIKASVVNGRVDCDLPIQLADGPTNRHKLKGTIGDGRATLAASSVNGSIHLKAR